MTFTATFRKPTEKEINEAQEVHAGFRQTDAGFVTVVIDGFKWTVPKNYCTVNNLIEMNRMAKEQL